MMKDEIKEILDNPKILMLSYGNYISLDDYVKLKDCITNLQEKVNQYENPEDMTLFYMWLDVKAKDKMKQLQEENKKLKELCDKYEEEHSTTFEYWKQLVKEDYKSRNKKVIEDIDLVIELIKQQPTEDDTWILNKLNGFKYLLQGEDKDVKD